jgi:hypothetical protein
MALTPITTKEAEMHAESSVRDQPSSCSRKLKNTP